MRTALFATALCLISLQATAEVIHEDRGGQIGTYVQKYQSARSSGETFRIDGDCLSGCTLMLGMMPRSSICVTAHARFGFHAAWMPNDDGVPVTSKEGTRVLWDLYASDVRRWITRHGGLTRKMIFLQGHDLSRYVPSCDQPTEARMLRSSKPHRHVIRTANARAR